MSNFRKNLKQELAFRDIKVKELASVSGVSKRTIDHYLAENFSEPLAEIAVKIAQALNVSVEYLVLGDEEAAKRKTKPEVENLVSELNMMSSDDLKLFSTLVRRYNSKHNNR